MRTPAILVAMLLALPAHADSLFNPEAEDKGNPVSNKRVEFKEGDIITVLIQESIDATTQANTNTKKESSTESEALSADNPFLTAAKPSGFGLLDAEKLPNWAIDLQNEHKTTGSTKRTNRLNTTVSCSVTKVHDNGNIDIEGQKKVSVNREDSSMYVKGTARSTDISSSNTISSLQLADATIELRGRGPLWNNQRRGLITKLLDWLSPF